jgi:hypothetical protein
MMFHLWQFSGWHGRETAAGSQLSSNLSRLLLNVCWICHADLPLHRQSSAISVSGLMHPASMVLFILTKSHSQHGQMPLVLSRLR